MILCVVGYTIEYYELDRGILDVKIEKDGLLRFYKYEENWYFDTNENIIGDVKNGRLQEGTVIELEYKKFYYPFLIYVDHDTKSRKQFKRYVFDHSVSIGESNADIIVDLKGVNVTIDKKDQSFEVNNESELDWIIINEIDTGIANLRCFHIQYLYLQIWIIHHFIVLNLVRESKLNTIPEINQNQVQQSVKQFMNSFFHMKKKWKPVQLQGPPILMMKSKVTISIPISQRIMTVGSLFVGLFAMLRGILQNRSWFEIAPSIILPFLMAITVFIVPLFENASHLRHQKKRLQQRDDDYLKQLNDIEERISDLKNQFLLYQKNRYPKKCDFTFIIDDKLLFHRKKHDFDYLYLLLGEGKVSSDIELSFPFQQLTEQESLLIKKQNELIEQTKTIYPALVELDLKEFSCLGFLLQRQDVMFYVNSVVAQLILTHHYTDFSLILLMNEDTLISFKEYSGFPHCYSYDLKRRFWYCRTEDFLEDWQYIEEILTKKTGVFIDLNDEFYDSIDLILSNNNAKVLQFRTTIFDFHSKTDCLVDIVNGSVIHDLKKDKYLPFQCRLSFYHSHSALKWISKNGIMLPLKNDEESFGLFRCFNAKFLEDLNCVYRWNERLEGIHAILGKDSYGRTIHLDLDEKGDGPHGLLCGTTGSGKSQLLLTLMLSLSIQYSPDDIQFVLLDYKGGSSFYSLMQKEIRLPHLVAFMNNLDDDQRVRSLKLLKKECEIRQKWFLEAASRFNKPIDHIDQYRQLPDCGLKKLSHLLLIIDEFAQLKKEEPDFFKELISIARIGRSLGIHLLLTTQKPSGIVDEQILSNISYKICMRVNSRQESKEVLGIEDAFLLSSPGDFCLVTPSKYETGKSAFIYQNYGKQPYHFELLSKSFKKIYSETQKQDQFLSEIDVLIPYLYKTASDLNVIPYLLWQKFPRCSLVNDCSKSNHSFIGFIDDIEHQTVSPVFISNDDLNVCVYGQEETERRNMIRVFLQGMMLHKEKIRRLFVISNESIFKKDESCRINYDEEENIKFIFRWIKKERTEHKILLIDDFCLFNPSTEIFFDLIELIQCSERYHLTLIIGLSSLNSINQRLLSLFKTKISLDRLSKQEQLMFYSKIENTDLFCSSILFSQSIFDFSPAMPLDFELLNTDNIICNSPLQRLFEKQCLKNYHYRYFPLGISEQSGMLMEASSTKNVLIVAMYTDVLKSYLDIIDQKEELRNRYVLLSNYFTEGVYDRQKMNNTLKDKKSIFIGLYFEYCQTTLRNQCFFEEIVWIGPGLNQQTLIPINELAKKSAYKKGVKSTNGIIEFFRCFDE